MSRLFPSHLTLEVIKQPKSRQGQEKILQDLIELMHKNLIEQLHHWHASWKNQLVEYPAYTNEQPKLKMDNWNLIHNTLKSRSNNGYFKRNKTFTIQITKALRLQFSICNMMITKITSTIFRKKWFLPTNCTTALHWGQITIEFLSWDLLNHSEMHPLLEKGNRKKVNSRRL